jgi:hypothetical protein
VALAFQLLVLYWLMYRLVNAISEEIIYEYNMMIPLFLAFRLPCFVLVFWMLLYYIQLPGSLFIILLPDGIRRQSYFLIEVITQQFRI